jgi:hypothetical protein
VIRAKRVKRPKMGINYAAIAAAGGIGKGPSIQLTKGWRKAAFEKALADAYEIVNKRDRDRSRITGVNLFPNTDNLKALREHNHLGKRSTHPSEETNPANIYLVSNYEHQFLTSGELLTHGTDANKELKFSWNRHLVKSGKEPFRIPRANQYRPGKAVAA